MNRQKPFQVSKLQVVEAYRRVKASAGGAGVDNQTLEDFDRNLRNNLYKIWNRLSSGMMIHMDIAMENRSWMQ